MRFTGRNLQLVRDGLALSLQEARNMIVTCPDVDAYAAELAEYEALAEYLQNLLERTDRALSKSRPSPHTALAVPGRPGN